MKKIFTILSFAGLSLFFSGCSDFMDSDYLFDERMSLEKVFSSRDYSNEWLARGYAFLGSNSLQEIASKKNMPFNFADDMYFDGENERYRKWKAGQYTESGLNGESKGIWETAYKGIRQVSIFIQNIDNNGAFSQVEIDDMKGQAHFLRAYYYWLILRTYGPVPIVPDEGVDYTKEYNEIAQARNTYDECVDYISSELIKAAGLLPVGKRPAEEIVRPTRGAALALRARVFLYAASPLFNGKAPAEVANALVNKDGTRLLPDTYNEYKWAKAAAAAKDVMDLNQYSLYVAYAKTTGDIAYPATIAPPSDGNFSEQNWPNGWKNIDPFESYRGFFNGAIAATENPELIFTRGQNGGGEDVMVMVIHQVPRFGGKGYNSHCMTQKQCDAYYMNDGTDIPGMNSMYAGEFGYEGRVDSRPRVTGFTVLKDSLIYPELGNQCEGISKQYVQREPRFYASVAYNGSTWNYLNSNPVNQELSNVQTFYYRGADAGYKVSYSLMTGIGIKKYVHPEDMCNTLTSGYDRGRLRKKVDPAIRYADILLMYAEALNELTSSHDVPSWDGSKSHNVSRNKADMQKGIQPVRIRAGVPDYTDEVYSNATLFRDKLKRERQIELFAEGQRYFDMRRWMDAPVEEAVQMYGCNIYCSASQAEIYHSPMPVPSMAPIFATKLWFWPIHHDELKHNNKLVQNPGWTNPE